jgi:nucleotide-binding universal stress UspA family protein
MRRVGTLLAQTIFCKEISETQPDLAMKQARDHNYVTGFMGNTDWDFIRQSPAHLWFVNDENTGQLDSLVTAIGASMDVNEIIAAADYDVFRLANLIAERFQASNTPIHAYQAPVGLSAYAAYAPEFGGIEYPLAGAVPAAEEIRQSIAQKHGRSIEAFASFFPIDPEGVRVVQGQPSDVLIAAAADLNANVIVMAAPNLSPWERWSQSVTAEPVLPNTQCDVAFVKEAGEAT